MLNTRSKRRWITTAWRDYILNILEDKRRAWVFRKYYRIYPSTFKQLCQFFRTRGHLSDTRDIYVEEQLAIFLVPPMIQCCIYVSCMDRFDRSIRTVTTYFNKVLDEILWISSRIYLPLYIYRRIHVDLTGWPLIAFLWETQSILFYKSYQFLS